MQTYFGYARHALERGDYATARHYALQAVFQMPWHPDSWRMLAKVLRRGLVRVLRPPRASVDAKS